MEAKEIIFFADELLDSSPLNQEAWFRTVIGRLYYGVFLQIQEWLIENYNEEFSTYNGSTHVRVTNCLLFLAEKYNRKEVKELAERLKNLKCDRVVADYKLERMVTRTSVNVAKSKSTKVLELFSSIQGLALVLKNDNQDSKEFFV